MITYYLCEETFKHSDKQISLDDFCDALVFMFSLPLALSFDVLLLIPEILYLGFKLLMRRFGK